MKIMHKSSSSNSVYEIDLKNLTCTCPHFMYRLAKSGGICKHIKLELEKYESQLENAKQYITENDNIDAVDFVEIFSEELLTLLKNNGTIFERNGFLIKV